MILSSINSFWQIPLVVFAALLLMWTINLSIRAHRDDRIGFVVAAFIAALVGVSLIVIAS